MIDQAIYPLTRLFMPAEFFDQSINRLNGWADFRDDRSNLTRRVAEALAKPMKELRSGELATLLRQRMGGDIVLALGLMVVSEEPLIRADSGSGDLLELVMQYGWADWSRTQAYGVDPYGLIGMVEATISGLRELTGGLEASFGRMHADCLANEVPR